MKLDDHMEALEKLCQVCGGNINKYRVKYVCEEHADNLRITFHLSILTDQPDVHPRLFCDCCYAVMKRKITAMENNKVYLPSIDLYVWEQHTHTHTCTTCNQVKSVKKGGRPKKGRKNRGKPQLDSCHDLIAHTKQISPEAFYHTDQFLTYNIPLSIDLSKSDIECSICCNLLNSPVQLICQQPFFLCASCLICWFESSQSTRCPSCDKYHSLTTKEITPINPMHLRVLESVVVKCNFKGTCGKRVRLKDLHRHTNSNCSQYYTSDHQPNTVSLSDIISQPITSTTSVTEKQVATHLVKRMMIDNHLTLQTGGQVYSL